MTKWPALAKLGRPLNTGVRMTGRCGTKDQREFLEFGNMILSPLWTLLCCVKSVVICEEAEGR